jgi:ethanolamine utilization protein EutN
MFLGRVQGHVVATAKDSTIKGYKLLIIEPLKVDYDDEAAAAQAPATEAGAGQAPAPAGQAPATSRAGGRFEVTGRAIVAMDTIGAGEGQLVLIVQGSSARLAEGMNKVPTDAVVVGIVDEAIVAGRKIN